MQLKTQLISSLLLGGFACTTFAIADESTKTNAVKVKLVSNSTSITSEPKNDSDANQSVRLQYKMTPGETIQTRVTHLAKTLTKINDDSQNSHSRTVSTKTWKVLAVEPNGNMTFEHSVAEVDASQQVGPASEIRYNSENGAVPKEFKGVDDKVNQVISTITIAPDGSVVNRTTQDSYARLGLGEIAIQFPQDPVAIDQQWECEREIQVRREDKTPMKVRLRELFTLKKVSAGVAVISVRNEALTPIRDAQIEAQVMQQMNNGDIRFDIDAGRLIEKNLVWDSTVIGFSGAGSRLEYSARLDEELLN